MSRDISLVTIGTSVIPPSLSIARFRIAIVPYQSAIVDVLSLPFALPTIGGLLRVVIDLWGGDSAAMVPAHCSVTVNHGPGGGSGGGSGNSALVIIVVDEFLAVVAVAAVAVG